MDRAKYKHRCVVDLNGNLTLCRARVRQGYVHASSMNAIKCVEIKGLIARGIVFQGLLDYGGKAPRRREQWLIHKSNEHLLKKTKAPPKPRKSGVVAGEIYFFETLASGCYKLGMTRGPFAVRASQYAGFNKPRRVLMTQAVQDAFGAEAALKKYCMELKCLNHRPDAGHEWFEASGSREDVEQAIKCFQYSD